MSAQHYPAIDTGDACRRITYCVCGKPWPCKGIIEAALKELRENDYPRTPAEVPAIWFCGCGHHLPQEQGCSNCGKPCPDIFRI